jgi:two-component system response regulator YesN
MRKNTIEEIWALIDWRFRDPNFCVKGICYEMGMGMSALYELVSMKCGTTPHELIEKRRLKEILRLMRNDYLPLVAIVSRSGFSSTRTFRRAFKKIFGMAPSEAAARLKSASEGDAIYSEFMQRLSVMRVVVLNPYIETVEEMTASFDRKNRLLQKP